jgi:hypothetical protein
LRGLRVAGARMGRNRRERVEKRMLNESEGEVGKVKVK